MNHHGISLFLSPIVALPNFQCSGSISHADWNTRNHRPYEHFYIIQAKYASYEENWFLQDLTASIELRGNKTYKIKYMIHVHFVVQIYIILYCTFNIQKTPQIHVLFVHIIILQLKKRVIHGLQLLTVKPVTDITYVCSVSLT